MLFCKPASENIQPPKPKLLYLLYIAFTVLYLLPTSTNSISFQISRFDPNTSNMVYEGDSVPFNGDFQLNRLDYITRIGQATYFDKQTELIKSMIEGIRRMDPNGKLTLWLSWLGLHIFENMLM
ncbi:hypothetical protein ACLOJK_036185 [Asimina triloba]